MKTFRVIFALVVCVVVLLAVAYVAGNLAVRARTVQRIDCRITALIEKRYGAPECNAMITDFDVWGLAFYCPQCKPLKKP